MPKPFLTYPQQIQKLKDKNLTITDDAATAITLHHYGYFALISGYKDLFKNPTTKDYRDGTTLDDIVALYRFDEQLRELTLRYLLQVERHIRSAYSYAFCSQFGESQNSYLDANNYNLMGRINPREVQKLITRHLQPFLSHTTDYPYIEHHKQVHGNVPLLP
jgi:abortive infection bacteriophage resistance protein